MAVETLIPVEEYLKTSDRPDRDYLEEIVEERTRGPGIIHACGC